MHTPDALLDLHARGHRSLQALLEHCRAFSADEIDREHAGFGYPSIRLQLAHGIGAEHYWIGVLGGVIDADDKDHRYPTVASLEGWRAEVAAATDRYLCAASIEELNTPRAMKTWGGREPTLVPAHVVVRTLTHIYQHQGQVVAQCRLLGRPASGLDFPLG